jgi:hypothetical protein
VVGLDRAVAAGARVTLQIQGVGVAPPGGAEGTQPERSLAARERAAGTPAQRDYEVEIGSAGIEGAIRGTRPFDDEVANDAQPEVGVGDRLQCVEVGFIGRVVEIRPIRRLDLERIRPRRDAVGEAGVGIVDAHGESHGAAGVFEVGIDVAARVAVITVDAVARHAAMQLGDG